jgi:hypothetical protein
MSICGECAKTVWPYFIVVFISGIVAFLTWLTLSAAGIEPKLVVWLTGGAFFGAFALLLSYIISCMRRHCRHHRIAHS